jgi:membrane protein DedA with SNARE-associated domain
MPNFHHNFQNLSQLAHFIKSGSYFGVFFLSIVVSYVFPLPEAIFLLLVGFVAKMTGMNLFLAIGISTVGIIFGDNILFRLSSLGNKYVEKFNRKMRKHKLIKYEHLVTDHVAFSVYFLKFVAGVRFFGPVILGSLGAEWKKFFVHNAVASFLQTALLVTLGFYLHKKIAVTAAAVEIFKNIMLLCSTIIVGVMLTIFSKRKEKV